MGIEEFTKKQIGCPRCTVRRRSTPGWHFVEYRGEVEVWEHCTCEEGRRLAAKTAPRLLTKEDDS